MFEVGLAIGVFLLLLLMGVPVAFAVIAGAIAGLAVLGILPMEALAQQAYVPTSSFSMLAIPFFILTADLLFSGRLGKQVIALATRIVGRFRGGVGMTSVVTNAIFAGVSGSAVADATGLGKIMIPWTKRLGFPAAYGASVNASASVLGVIIPPSIPMILYAAASGVSVGAIFSAGLIPGLVMAVLLMVGCWFLAFMGKYPLVRAKVSMKKFLIDLLFATPAILIPIVLIRVVLFTGMATVTEVSAITALYAVLIRILMYRDLSWKTFVKSAAESAAASAVVLLLIMFSTSLAWFLTIQEAPQNLARLMTATFDSKAAIIGAMILVLALTGMFLDMAPAILLLTPVLMPLAIAIEMDPIHLGILMVVVLAIGLYTPPVGTTLYISAAIGRVSVMAVTKQLLVFYVLVLAMVFVVAYAPGWLLIPH